jgi:DNA-binding NarL/FixJ family response regulator
VRRRLDELDDVRAYGQELEERFGDELAVPTTPIEIAEGSDAALQQWIQVQESAQQEVLIIDKPPYVYTGTEPNRHELRLLAKGIRYRVLYDTSSLESPGKIEAARTCIAAGEEARVLADVPLKLLLADQRIALTYDLRPDGMQDLVVIRQSSLLDSLVVLFDALWHRAVPLRFDGSTSKEDGSEDQPLPAADDQRLLELMAAGLKDEAVARHLDVGIRTVRRRVSALTDQLGARTRFQAGMLTERRGWLNDQ